MTTPKKNTVPKTLASQIKPAREAKAMSQNQLADLVNKMDGSVKCGKVMICDIERGAAGAGPKASRVIELATKILNLDTSTAKQNVKTIQVHTNGAGFSFEASTDVVKRLKSLGVATAEVKASLVKAFSDLLDQAEK